ncbi:hypothetical protein LMG7974_01591 [Campylobacter majalis]|uniref:Plasmid replication protein RepL domain-containing protein n=1 Tax=Campylobacter majalis TaxID=2790656 RepID=A0ABM8Q9I0_9BACT|nr:replication/maintenance protein RepL [Campylobacter majalis]CAD7289514.1 hypothetical protein LMG7974_01591 [Campylobacter majalis]
MNDLKEQYINDLKVYLDTNTSVNLMLAILDEVDENNKVILTKPTKEKISKRANISLETINSLITKLISKGLIKRISSKISKEAIYILDIEIFGKKKWDKIKTINMHIEYDLVENKKNKKIQIEYKTEEKE